MNTAMSNREQPKVESGVSMNTTMSNGEEPQSGVWCEHQRAMNTAIPDVEPRATGYRKVASGVSISVP